MKTSSSFPGLVFLVILAIGAAAAFSIHRTGYEVGAGAVFVLALLCAALISSSIRVADQWSKAVVLRLGKFRSLEGPGLFFIIPLIETIPYWIDTRVLTSSFKAEKTLTKDTVPVDVDAVLFWKIVDPQKAALEGRWETTMRFWNGPQLLIVDLCRYRDYADIVAVAGLNVLRCLGFRAMTPAGLSA